ncbi:cache domain-containing sensor histidine kinase [Streptococcus fryi]
MRRYPLSLQLLGSVVLSFCLIFATVGSIYYHTSSNAIRTRTEASTRDSLEQSSQFVSAYINRMRETSSALSNHPLLKTYAETSDEEDAESIASLFETVLKMDRDLITAVFVTKTGQVISTNPDVAMKTSDNMMKEDWYQEAIHQNASPVLIPARQDLGEDWVISVTQEVTDSSGNNLGVLRLDSDYQTMATYLDQLNLGKDGFSFIVNEQEAFVYHPESTVYRSSQEMAEMAPYIAIRDGYTEDHQTFVYQIPVPDSNWHLIGVASLDGLLSLQHKLLLTFLMVGFLTTVLCFLWIWWLLRWWIKPLKDFRQVMLAIGAGESHLRAEEKGSVEVVDLTKQFNKMLDQIDLLMIAVQDKEKAIRTYELQALASQINPHFLYNTLDTIIWMAEFNDKERVVELTKSLAKYFRLALNKGHEQITLKDELDHVSQYLYIQKQRYGDQLTYQIKSKGDFDSVILPKLVLQPIVENAIYHGIKQVSRPGMITISVTEELDYLRISIEDNGKGISSTDKEPSAIVLGGVGLKNVDERLRLQFGESYQMKIETEPDAYTRIHLYLPIAN